MPAVSSLPALNPATAPIDGKSPRDRLAFAAQFARLIRFYNLDNQIEGNWQPFLLKDAAILLAYIAATDYHGLHAQYESLTHINILPPAAQQALLPALFALLHDMFSLLADWFHWLKYQPENFPLRAFLERSVREQLAPDLARLRDLHQALFHQKLVGMPDMAWYSSLESAWQSLVRLAPHSPSALHENNTELVTQALTALRQYYLDTLDVIIHTVDAASSHYDQVAREPTTHPDTALLRVFVDLMKYQQEKINQIGYRHLDFYYKNVLQIEARKSKPDQVVVLLSPAPDQSSVILPPGTAFAAGKDADGLPLWYANPEEAVINTARIKAAFSLKAQMDEKDAHGFLPGIHATCLFDVETLQKGTSGQVLDQAVFGTPNAQPQGLGFALASPILLLEGGNRSLLFTLELDEATDKSTDQPLPEAWEQGWQYWLSSSKGWFDATPYALPPYIEPANNGQPAKLVLELMLPPDALPVLASEKPLDGRSCPWPQIKCILPPISSAYSWPSIHAVNVQVKVRELTHLQLWNELAPLTAAAPTPLGPMPQAGHRFFVGSREIFAKPVDKMVLTLQWANLPGNLKEWYSEYNHWQQEQHPDWPPFDNTVHRGCWQWLQADGWQTPALNVPTGKMREALFQENSKSVFTFRFGPSQRPNPQLALDPLPLPHDARAGYLAFTLQNPPQAFGHYQYPQVLIWSSQQQAERLINAKDSAQQRPVPGIPNPPFTPLLQTAFAEYSASLRLLPGAEPIDKDPSCPFEWFHYSPWHHCLAWQNGSALENTSPLDPAASGSRLSLVPRVTQHGALFLALDALNPPCSLRLFASVTDNGNAHGFDAWLYSAQGWQAVEVWQDDSKGLSGTGIIELSLQHQPASLPLSPELAHSAWLAITPRGAWRALRLKLLATQAVRLERQNLPPDSKQVPSLTPGNITKPPIAQLATVRQPLASQHGRPAENDEGYAGANNYYMRVSQRLLHKGRALTPRDFVLLAHEAMPELYHVALLPNLPSARGEIRLGVIPRIGSATESGAFRPRLLSGDHEQLAACLQACSPTHRVSVTHFEACEITLCASLILSPASQAAWPSLRHEWNRLLMLYLSPWITTDQPQYDLKHGIGRADLLHRFASFPGVLAIEKLCLTVQDNNGNAIPIKDDVLLPSPGAIWVSAQQHLLTLAES